MFKKTDKEAFRLRRHLRARKKVKGTSERPRLAVFRSGKNIYAQVIDDVARITLVAASTIDKDFSMEVGSNKVAAKLVGGIIAKKAIEKGIKQVVFDRGGYIYHGRIQELAAGAREGGLEF